MADIKSNKPDINAVERFCDELDEWARLMMEAEGRIHDADAFRESWEYIRLCISKSCLLDRVLYHGEKPSRTPCPVHQGKWAGCHLGWPGQEWVDIKSGSRSPVEVSPMLQKWFDEGCRCFQHKCGCTTGWQPDEHCGCLNAK